MNFAERLHTLLTWLYIGSRYERKSIITIYGEHDVGLWTRLRNWDEVCKDALLSIVEPTSFFCPRFFCSFPAGVKLTTR